MSATHTSTQREQHPLRAVAAVPPAGAISASQAGTSASTPAMRGRPVASPVAARAAIHSKRDDPPRDARSASRCRGPPRSPVTCQAHGSSSRDDAHVEQRAQAALGSRRNADHSQAPSEHERGQHDDGRRAAAAHSTTTSSTAAEHDRGDDPRLRRLLAMLERALRGLLRRSGRSAARGWRRTRAPHPAPPASKSGQSASEKYSSV